VEIIFTGREAEDCGMKWATEQQIRYYEYLCKQAYVEPEEGYKDWDVGKMSAAIRELKEIVK
jgi:hypothetical protein